MSAAEQTLSKPASPRRPSRLNINVGDLVVTKNGYPILYEVIDVQDDNVLRVRGLNWAPGYSALVSAQEIRLSTGILSR